MATRLSLAATLLLLASPAWADSFGAAGEAPRAASTTPQKPSSFDGLSAGDRKIARALFLAQHPTASGPAPLSLNQIADLKVGDSWAKVFKVMQAKGLLHAKSLGQVVDGYEHQRRSDGGGSVPSRHGATRGTTTIIVMNGRGGVAASTRHHGDGAGVAHGGAELPDAQTTAVATAADSDDTTHGR
jgi:hypothetical protein